MKLTLPLVLGTAAFVASSMALLLALSNNHPAPKTPLEPSTHQTQLKPAVNVEGLTEQLTTLNQLLSQTRDQLTQLQSRQLKLENYTRSKFDTLGSTQLDSETTSNTASRAATPMETMGNNEALNKRDQHSNYLEDVLYEQELDPQWSSQMSGDINQALAAIPGNLAESSYVQCQSTLCMVELTVDAEEVDEFIIKFNTEMADSAQQMRSFAHNRGDGKLTMQMYLAKAGHDLPDYQAPPAMP